MKRVWVIGLVMIAALGGSVMLTAQQGRSLDVQMKAAQQKADVQGDLRGAIEDYEKIVAAASGNRVLAAQALVNMAECYQKLGDAESRRIYERIVRDYADQTDAATLARARLGNTPPGLAGGIVTRPVWTGRKVDAYGTVSPDGRFISFTDWDTGELAVHDLVTGQDRTLTNKGGWDASLAFADGSRISHDGKQIAYTWTIARVAPGEDTFAEVRLIDVNGGTPRVLFSNRSTPNRGVRGIAPMDWSPDGKWLAVSVRKNDGTIETALLSTADGTERVLKSHQDCEGADCRHQLLFSADGRHLVYDWASKGGTQRQVYVIPAAGGSETALLAHAANDRVLGWASDGKHLVFASDRSGVSGIWAVPVTDGQAQGEPRLLRANVSPASLGMTRAGALYYAVGNPSRDVFVADVDLAAGRVVSAPVIIAKPFVGLNDFPRWSPDGHALAYLAQKDPNSRSTQLSTLLIRSMESGEVRDLNVRLRYLNVMDFGPIWTPDGSALIVNAFDLAGQQGIFRVNAQTGDTQPLVMSDPRQGEVIALALSPDGRTLYISRNPMGVGASQEIMLAHDLASGREREIARRALQWGRGVDLSPDGRWIVRTAVDRPNAAVNVTYLLLYSVDGGTPRELLRASSPDAGIMGSFAKFTADGESIVFARGTNRRPREIWRISREGGDPRQVGLSAEWALRLAQPGTTSTSMHPDGHHVAFATGGNEVEVWAMENITAALNAGK